METNTPQTSHPGRTILKVLLWIIGIPLLLVVLLIIALLFPTTQNWLADKGTGYLADKLKTEVRIGRVKTDFRNSLVLEDFYLEDQRGDTLVHAGRLGLDMNFFSLLKSEINISSVTLSNATAHIKTFMPDSTTNYDFVLNAFAADTATAQPVDTTAAPFTYNVGNVELQQVFFTMQDQIYGNNVRTRIGSLNATMHELAPEKEIYRLKNIALKNSYINFTQTKIPPPDTAATKPLTLQFGLGQVELDKVKFNFENKIAAQRISLAIGQAKLKADNINLPEAKVDLANFQLQNSFVGYFQDKYTATDSLAINPAKMVKDLDESVEESRGEPVNWVVTLNNLDVKGLNVQFGNYNTPVQKQGMDFNHLDFKDILLDVNNVYYSQNRIAAALKNMQLQEKSGFMVKNFRADIVVDSVHAALANLQLETGESIVRRHLEIGYPALETMADNLERLTINADLANSKIGFRDLLYFQPALANNPSFRSILNKPLYVDGRITGRMSNLRVQRLQAAGLNGTALNVTGTITGLPDPEKTQADLTINRFTASKADILAFLPPGSLPPGYQIPSRITLSGGINGGMQNIALENVQLTAGPNTALQATGTIRNLQNPDNLYANLRINQFKTTRADIQNLLPASLIPPDIQIPEQMRVSGTFTGSIQNFTTNSTINTSFGDAKANIRLRPGERYNGTVSLDAFNLGKLLKMPETLGTITTTAKVNGSGLTPETMQANIVATVQQVQYNNYNYTNIAINGNANRNLFTGKINMNDNNLAFNFDGTVDMRTAEPSYNFTADLGELNLQALNFLEQPLRLQGKIAADMRGASLNTLAGTLDAGNLTIRQGAKTHTLDSLFVRLNNSVGRTDMIIRSDIVNGYFRGANSAEDLPVALAKHIDSYFNIQDAAYPANITLNDFNFDLRFRRTQLLTTGLVPDLKKFGPGIVSGSYVSATHNLDVDGYLPQVIYTTYNLDSLQLQLNGNGNRLTYAVTTNELSDSTLLIKNLKLAGFAEDDNLKVRLGISEDSGQERFALGGMLENLQNAYQFKFTQGDVVINNTPWNVNPDNYLRYATNGAIYAHDIRLSNNGSALAINSVGTNTQNAPLQIGFTNFQLSDVSQAIERTDSLVSGTVNGTVTLQNITTKLGFTSDLKVANFAFQKNLIGDMSLQASTAGGDRYNLLANLTGNGNNATINGYYIAQTTDNALNLNADIRNLNLAILEGFMAGVLEDLSGTVTGQLGITGSIAQPTILGTANFREATFSLGIFGAVYRLPNETLQFNEQGINMNNFTLIDSTNNKAVINGTIFTQNYLDYRFALDADAKNFVILNSTATDNPLYYGLLIVDADAKVQGSMNRPVINTNLKVLPNSAVTMVIPAAAAGRVEHTGIVEFVDLDDTVSTRLAQQSMTDTLSQTEFTGLEINAVIDVNEAAAFTVVIDPTTGDYIEIKGNGLLNAGIDPSGKISLSGRYEARAGKYQLNFFDLAEREFVLDPGSTITWKGDPIDATLDVRAIYNIETAPYELVVDQSNGQNANQYRQEFPFQVFINLRGAMLKPDISFDIQLPENERAGVGGEVAAKLALLRQDPSELNRQVFSLIVLGRFMAQDPLQSAGGGGLESIARNSVSDLLSDQLNKLTGDFLGGLGLELGLNSYQDYSSGAGQNRTDLNVALNQQFLNNRLVVKVGTDVGLEGGNNRATNQGNTGGFGGTVSVEYLILKDGRLRLRAFKQPAADVITEAAVQETGVALIYVRDFNSFSDLFSTLFKSNIK